MLEVVEMALLDTPRMWFARVRVGVAVQSVD